jgi:hypothetical protein
VRRPLPERFSAAYNHILPVAAPAFVRRADGRDTDGPVIALSQIRYRYPQFAIMGGLVSNFRFCDLDLFRISIFEFRIFQ